MEDREYTFADWVVLEQENPDIAYGFVDGGLIARAGGTYEYALVKDNVAAALRAAFGSRCRVTTSDVRAKTREMCYRFPDVVVVCHEKVDREVVPGIGEAVLNPALLVEGISESTSIVDHEDKLSSILLSRRLRNTGSSIRQTAVYSSFETTKIGIKGIG